MNTRSELRRINVQQGRAVNDGLETMTDNEIIKKMERWIEVSRSMGLSDLRNSLVVFLDLINRQKAEIEEWKAEVKRVCAERDAHIFTNKFIIAEAIKEFAERLLEKAKSTREYFLMKSLVTTVLNEMEGGE